jgi:hypothetical protein
VRLIPVEEMIWQKAFIMERHRFDGNDVVHLLNACARTLNWNRLLARFGAHGLVLLVHLLLLRYVYPASWSDEMTALAGRILGDLDRQEGSSSSCEERPICRGTLLSLLDYLSDVEGGRYFDARLLPYGRMTAADIAHWTAHFDH